MEIQELKRDLEIFFTDSENGYGLYSTERLLILAQQGDEKAKLQILFNFKGLIYKTLVNNSYYLQLSAGDILQNLSEVVLQRMAVWKPKAAAAFGNHIKKAAVSRIRARALRHLQELLAAGRQRGERLC